MSRVTVPACTAVARVMKSSSLVYGFGFESGAADSWSGLSVVESYGSVTEGVRLPHRGGYMAVQAVAPPATSTSSRVMTGLTVGRTYTLSAWARRGTVDGSSLAVNLGITGASGTPFVLPGRKWYQVFYTFTATATSTTARLLAFRPSGAPAVDVLWDDIRLLQHEYQDGTDLVLGLRGGSTLTMDEREAPYIQAALRIAMPEQEVLDLLDTRSSTSTVRVVVTLGQEFITPAQAPQSRTFDLLLHERDADHAESSEVTLICHSDEAVLIDAGNDTTVVDEEPSLDAPSLRAIVSTMLQKHGYRLASATADADFTITYAATNLVGNPRCGTNTTGWVRYAGTGSLSRQGSGADTYLRFTCSSSQSTYAVSFADIPVTPGEVYVLSARVRSSVGIAGVLQTFSGGSWDVQQYVVLPANTWVDITFTSTCPDGVTTTAVRVLKNTGGSVSSGTTLDVTNVRLSAEGAGDNYTYFDGAMATDDYYSYVWDGTAHASTSRRIRLDDRDPRLLFQDPGEKDFDVLQQLVQAAGLRLFCDESRDWYLVDPTDAIVAGLLELEDTRRGRDRISRERGDWADAVVVKYTWIGEDGTQQVRYDAATNGGTCLQLIEWDRPWPGPGAAAAILARYAGRGRVQEITAPPDLTATPAIALTTELPNAPAQEGYASRVTYTLDESALEMSIIARDLVDA